METRNINSQFCSSPVNGTDDREARSKFWIAAYTRPRSEKKAAIELVKGTPNNPGIETYCPTQTHIKQWSDRKKKIESVVIPMIVFAHVSDEEIKIVEQNPLIVRVLRYPGHSEPAHIPESQIDQLKFMLNGSQNSVIFESFDFKVADKVQIIRGAMKGLKGFVERTIEGKTFFVLYIDCLGGAKVLIDTSDCILLQKNAD